MKILGRHYYHLAGNADLVGNPGIQREISRWLHLVRRTQRIPLVRSRAARSTGFLVMALAGNWPDSRIDGFDEIIADTIRQNRASTRRHSTTWNRAFRKLSRTPQMLESPVIGQAAAEALDDLLRVRGRASGFIAAHLIQSKSHEVTKATISTMLSFNHEDASDKERNLRLHALITLITHIDPSSTVSATPAAQLALVLSYANDLQIQHTTDAMLESLIEGKTPAYADSLQQFMRLAPEKALPVALAVVRYTSDSHGEPFEWPSPIVDGIVNIFRQSRDTREVCTLMLTALQNPQFRNTKSLQPDLTRWFQDGNEQALELISHPGIVAAIRENPGLRLGMSRLITERATNPLSAETVKYLISNDLSQLSSFDQGIGRWVSRSPANAAHLRSMAVNPETSRQIMTTLIRLDNSSLAMGIAIVSGTDINWDQQVVDSVAMLIHKSSLNKPDSQKGAELISVVLRNRAFLERSGITEAVAGWIASGQVNALRMASDRRHMETFSSQPLLTHSVCHLLVNTAKLVGREEKAPSPSVQLAQALIKAKLHTQPEIAKALNTWAITCREGLEVVERHRDVLAVGDSPIADLTCELISELGLSYTPAHLPER